MNQNGLEWSGHASYISTERLPRCTLFKKEVNCWWLIDHMTKSMKTLTSKLARVGKAMLLNWGPRDLTNGFLK